MSARRALPVDVDVAALEPLAADAAARRALEHNLSLSSTARRAIGEDSRGSAGEAPARALLDDLIIAFESESTASERDQDAPARAARRALARDEDQEDLASSLAKPSRAIDSDASPAIPVTINCVPRRALDADQEPTTAVLPKYEDAAFVKRPSRIKQLAAGLATFALLGGFGSRVLATAGAAGQPTTDFVAAAAAPDAGHEGEPDQADHGYERPASITGEQLAQSAALDDQMAEFDRAEAVEEARVKAEAEAKAAKAAAVTGNIAPGQRPPLSVDEAMANAQRLSGSGNYNNMCLALVSNFYGYTSSGAVGAQQAAGVIIAAGQMHYDMNDIPVGALIWYDGNGIGNPYGHVAMYAGDGMVYSNGHQNGVGLMSINKASDEWRQPIIGWSNVWLPEATN